METVREFIVDAVTITVGLAAVVIAGLNTKCLQRRIVL